MIVIDTSVAVPAALTSHAAHQAARSALPRGRTRALAQVVVETYSVLTRLPQRISPASAATYVGELFEFPPLVLGQSRYRDLLELGAAAGVTGGEMYDAIVGATAADAGATLLTRDGRAVATYRLVGADFHLVA